MTGRTDREIHRIWGFYKRWHSPVLRRALIEHYAPLLKAHARRLRSKLPNSVEVDELTSAGTFGLMAAVESYDPGRGIKFETYSSRRIRGAMLDELRALDWVPRLVRQQSRRLSETAVQLRVERGQAPTWEEIARRLNTSVAAFRRMSQQCAPAGMFYLSQRQDPDGNWRDSPLGTLIDHRAPTPCARPSTNWSRNG